MTDRLREATEYAVALRLAKHLQLTGYGGWRLARRLNQVVRAAAVIRAAGLVIAEKSYAGDSKPIQGDS